MFLVKIIFQCNAHVWCSLVEVYAGWLAATDVFICKKTHPVWNYELAQPAEEIEIIFHFILSSLNKGSCFFLMALWIEILLSISISLMYFEYCSFPRRSIEYCGYTIVSFMQSWLSKVINSLDESMNGFPIVMTTSHILVTCFLKVSMLA